MATVNNSRQRLTILKIVNCAELLRVRFALVGRQVFTAVYYDRSIVGRHVCSLFDKKESTLTEKL
jgi:hypothetical protein